MWKFTKSGESSTGRFKLQIQEHDHHISNKHFLQLLREDRDFVVKYNRVLSDCGFEAFYWENKPVSNANINKTYECCLIKSDALAGVSPDKQAFKSYFIPGKQVVSFPNLGGDALLIAPCPIVKPDVYAHIGNFVRIAPEDQIVKFWKVTAENMLKQVDDEPKWLSTSGLGVYWLHVRIDSYPKYYQTEEYKEI